MARPKCARLIKDLPEATYFKPRGVPLTTLEEIALTFDELEAIRLADLEALYQEEAAMRMKISRATFGRILESARRKVADALINGKAVRIEGGIIKMAPKRKFKCAACDHEWEVGYGTGRPAGCPECGGNDFHRAESDRGHGHGGGMGGCRRRRGAAVNGEVAK